MKRKMSKDDDWKEVAFHVYEHKETGQRVLSAERTWKHLKENLKRLRNNNIGI